MSVNFFLKISILILISLIYGSSATAKKITPKQYKSLHIKLDSLQFTEDPDRFFELFSKNPSEKLLLPKIETSKAYFFKVYYSKTLYSNPEINIMVIKEFNGEYLYIDRNNNKNLTDDGEPIFFPSQSNTTTFNLTAPQNAHQITTFKIYRKPEDNTVKNDFDSLGNLKPKCAQSIGAFKNISEFKGTKGTFYLVYPQILKSGYLIINNKKYRIGLFDYDNNGIFKDSCDYLIFDSDRNGKLECFSNDIQSLKDIFSIGKKNYKVSNADRYGNFVELTETFEGKTKFAIHKQPTESMDAPKEILDSNLWNQCFYDIQNNKIQLKEFKDKPLILNFWGEWCGACKMEIPDLVKLSDNKKIQIISFLNTKNIKKVRQIVKSEKMKWPQIVASEQLLIDFKIISYPTNLLILKYGKTVIRLNGINSSGINRYLE